MHRILIHLVLPMITLCAFSCPHESYHAPYFLPIAKAPLWRAEDVKTVHLSASQQETIPVPGMDQWGLSMLSRNCAIASYENGKSVLYGPHWAPGKFKSNVGRVDGVIRYGRSGLIRANSRHSQKRAAADQRTGSLLSFPDTTVRSSDE